MGSLMHCWHRRLKSCALGGLPSTRPNPARPGCIGRPVNHRCCAVCGASRQKQHASSSTRQHVFAWLAVMNWPAAIVLYIPLSSSGSFFKISAARNLSPHAAHCEGGGMPPEHAASALARAFSTSEAVRSVVAPCTI